LRDPKTKLPDGSNVPDFIFDFTEEELSVMKTIAGGKDLINKVIPKHRLKQGDSLRTRYSMGGDDMGV
jgi:hypothetical protein